VRAAGWPTPLPSPGYESVDEAAKAARVASVFSSVAPSYDVMNDLMSVGMHRLWKVGDGGGGGGGVCRATARSTHPAAPVSQDHLVSTLGAPVAGTHHLDVAGGTGDVGFRVLRRLREADVAAADAAAASRGTPPALSSVTVCDINPDMLAEGRRKAEEAGLGEGFGEKGSKREAACINMTLPTIPFLPYYPSRPRPRLRRGRRRGPAL